MPTTQKSTPQRHKGPSAHELAVMLRQAIIDGELAPKQRLIEADIAEEYGASRGNIRIAFSELSTEGYIERIRNRGARVRAVSSEEAIEIIEVRAAIEALCAAKAAERITDQEIEELHELGRIMVKAVEANEKEAYSQGNQKLHRRVIEISNQKTAADTIQRIRGQAVRFQYQLSQKPGRPTVSLPQHLAIIETICARQPQEAALAMTRHLESVAQEIRELDSSEDEVEA